MDVQLTTKSPAAEAHHGSLADITKVDLAAVMRAYPALAQISDRVWHDALARAMSVNFAADEILFRGGGPVTHLLLILEGAVRVYLTAPDGRQVTLYRVQPGDLCILSLYSLLQHRNLYTVAQTTSAVQAIGILAADFHKLMAESEQFRAHVLTTTGGRLCEVVGLVQDLTFQNLNGRLACLLGRLSARAGSSTIQITHQELARELGTTREVVSRLLKEFEQQNYVRLARGQIVLNGTGPAA